MATNCDISKGRLAKCKNSIGGLFRIFYINWGPVVLVRDADDAITDITTDGATPLELFEWNLKGGSSLIETPTVSVDNGTAFWEQVVTAIYKKLEAEARQELMLLTYGKFRMLVQDNNGNTIFLGYRFGMDVSGASWQTGTNMEDLSGYNVVHTGRELESGIYLAGSTLADPWAGLTIKPNVTQGV